MIGQLLAAPPAKGELRAAIAAAGRARRGGIRRTGEPVRFGFSTIERWYYRALEGAAPIRSACCAASCAPMPASRSRSSDAVRQALLAQYAAHKSWSVQLHHDNLVALAETRPELQAGAVLRDAAPLHEAPTASTSGGALTPRRTDGAERAEARLAEREVRSYEAEYVNGLWHWDCHHGSRKVLTPRGEWAHADPVRRARRPLAAGLPSAVVSGRDRRDHRPRPVAGVPEARPAARRAERQRRRDDRRRDHRRPRPARHPAPDHAALQPYQNAKQEAFWGPVEGRLMAMLEGVADLTLAVLNEATQAWVEQDYNRKRPLRDRRDAARALPRRSRRDAALPRQRRAAARLHAHRARAPSARATAPSSSRAAASRSPTATAISTRIEVRYAAGISATSTSSTSAPAPCSAGSIRRTRRSNASGLRRSLDPVAAAAAAEPRPTPAPASRRCSRSCSTEQAATGLPPAYLPKRRSEDEETR